jgi:putative Ca2+/H+ antiporter (TMEM165/GDT1 family)
MDIKIFLTVFPAGTFLSAFINVRYLHDLAGVGFILIGALTLFRA